MGASSAGRRALDAGWVGAALALALAGWTLVVAAAVGGDPTPLVALTAASVAVGIAAAHVARRTAVLVPALVVLAGGVLWILPELGGWLGTPPSGRPYGPLGHANASGLFHVVVAVSAAAVGLQSRSVAVSVLAMAALAGAVLTVVGSRSVAAHALVAEATLLLAATWLGQGRAARTVAVTTVVVSVAATVTLGAMHATGAADGITSAADEVLSGRRLALWGDGLRLIREHPLNGVGPGRFDDHSLTARSDHDGFDPHNAYLLLGAELGLPGLILGGALLVWALRRSTLRSDVAGGAALAAVTALATHSTVDYVLRAPAVVLVAVALVAAAGRGPEPPRAQLA